MPGYAQKLEKSMDKYFASMPFGKIIFRANWSISTNGVLFKLGSSGQHLDVRNEKLSDEGGIKMAPPTYVPTSEEMAAWREKSKTIDGDKCCLRMERQTLHRLEKTGALVFGFKTFLEPLSELRKEGSGPALAAAMDGLGAGSVPAADVYKSGVIWKEPLKDYLMR